MIQMNNIFCVQEIEMKDLEKHFGVENESSRKTYYREFKKVSDILLV